MESTHTTHGVNRMPANGSPEAVEKTPRTARDRAITASVLSIVVALLVSLVGSLVVAHRDAEFEEHCTATSNGYGLVLNAGETLPGGLGGADLTVSQRSRVCLTLPGGFVG